MRIKQACVLKSFEDSFHKRWGTKKVTKVDEPMIMFGCFHQKQVDIIAQWKALVVVVWVGSDSLYLRTGKYDVDYTKILYAPHVKHVAISKWIVDDLSACGVLHTYLPITHVNFEQFKPTPLGDSVYCYCPAERPEIYGRKIIDAVKDRMPDVGFVITSSYDEIQHDQIQKFYETCFIGLRPTSHDGQPTTVAEMGLTGRRVIHNGLSPNCIPWRSIGDIVQSIRLEQQYIGHTNNRLVKEVSEFLDIGDDWLNTEFYGGAK